MAKQSLFITSRTFPPVLFELLQEKFEITCWESKINPTKDQFIENIRGKFGVICSPAFAMPMDNEVMEAAGNSLKVVSTLSVGLDHLDIEKLKSRNVRIGYTPNVSNQAVAEYAIALLLATSRHVVEAHNFILRGNWVSEASSKESLDGTGLYNSVSAVVGCGRIGIAILKRLKSFEPKRLLYYARNRKLEADELDAEFQPLDAIMKNSDFIIVALDRNPQTIGIISREMINSMKSNAILVNIGRGDLLDEVALIEALQNNKIAGAGLDVYKKEPLPNNSPLVKMNNVVLSPHIAAGSIDCLNSMGALTALNVLAVLNGTEMPAEVL